MLYPEFIVPGKSKIAVTAPSDGNSKEYDYRRLDFAEANLKNKGVEVIETANVRSSCKGRSSGAEDRARQFMEVWDNPEVSAVISAKGGDFLMEMLTYTDFDRIRNNPKWFQGYSDNTGLAFTITTLCDIASVYCNNFNDFAMKEWHKSVDDNWNMLCGQAIIQTSFEKFQNGYFDGENGDEGYNLNDKAGWRVVNGKAPVKMGGRLIGGCLDVLLNIVGTRFDNVKEFVSRYGSDGILWYMESFSLSSEAVERGLWQLSEAGWFENAAGFIFWRPAFFNSYTDTSYEEAVMNALAKYDVSVILDADIGHKPPQFTMINGALCEISYDGVRGTVRYEYR